MVKLAVLASVGLTLVARAMGSEIASELENHYNGYPHTTPVTATGVQANQAGSNNPQVNSFLPLIFSYTARRPTIAVTPTFGQPASPAVAGRIITVEQNGGPGDVPTYLFNGQKPAVENNYPSIFPAKAGRKLMQTGVVSGGNYGACFSYPSTPLQNVTTSADWENLKIAACSGGRNLTNPVKTITGRRLQQITANNLVLKMYGEVKKSSTTGFPQLTYVLDFTTRPLLKFLMNPQSAAGVIRDGGTVTFQDCVIYLPDGAFVRSKAGTCFDDTPVVNGVPQPVIVRLGAKSFYYGSNILGPNTGANGGTQVAPLAAFAFNYLDTASATGKKSIIFQMGNGGGSTIVQAYGVYADISGIYPGQTK